MFNRNFFQLQDLNLSSEEVLFAGEAGKDGQFFGQLEIVGSQKTLSDALERMAEAATATATQSWRIFPCCMRRMTKGYWATME